MSTENNTPRLRFPGFTGEWEEKKFGELIEESRESSTTENEDTLLTSSIEGMYLNSEVFSHQRGSTTIGYRKIKKGMLVLSAQNLHLGNANVNMRFDSGLVSPAYKVYNIVGCLPQFLGHWVKREETKQFFFNATTQGASECRRNVVWEQLYKQTLPIPSLPEQQKIASCLSEMDNLITAQGKRVEALKEKKKGLMQQLFPQNGEKTPRLRFPGFEGEWVTQPLSKFLYEHKTKSDGKCEVHSVSVSKGVVNQVEYLGRSFAAKDTSKYNLVKPNDIIYTKSPTGDFPYGIVKMNKNPYNVIVSPLYAVYSPINKYVGYILDSYFESPINAKNYLSSLVQKGAKNTIQITNDTFISKSMCFPTDEAEQQKIALCLSELDALIASESEKEEALKKHKKGLMQQLFPQPTK